GRRAAVGRGGAGRAHKPSDAARGGRAGAGAHGERRGPQGADRIMIARLGVVVIVAVLTLAALAPPASGFDSAAVFAKGTYVISGEGVYGVQFNVEWLAHHVDTVYC